MNIYILSSGRPNRQITYGNLPRDLKYTIIFVVPKKDIMSYLETYGDCNFIFHKKNGISATRQYVLEHSTDDKILMLDDDLTFYTRREEGNFVKSWPDHLNDLFDAVCHELDDYAHVGLCNKFMSQAQPRVRNIGLGYYQILAYNKALFPKPYPRFRMPIAEEHDFHLQLRSKGLVSSVLTEWAKADVSHAPGGCEEWRTYELERDTHRKMAETWPGIVKVVPTKKFCGTTMRIAWKKLDKQVQNDSNLYSV